MKDKLNFYIDGSWVKSKSKEKIAVINPANEELIGHISSGTKDDINKLTVIQLYNKIRSLTEPYPNAFLEDKNGDRIYFKGVSFEKND